MSISSTKKPTPSHRFYNLEDDKMNAWNKEILENLLPQYILYEPECLQI